MSDTVKLIIEIPETAYEGILNANKARGNWGNDLLGVLCNGVVAGIPLPKGHGRLIDADALEKKMCDREEELGDDRALWESSAVSVALDMFAPTIIEADQESEDKDDTDR